MTWLVYIPGLRAPSPRVIHNVDEAGNPILGETERGRVLAQHRLTDTDRAALSLPRGLDALVRRYPPPGPHGDDPAPVTPAPVQPCPSGSAAAKMEVAA